MAIMDMEILEINFQVQYMTPGAGGWEELVYSEFQCAVLEVL